jgi:hypothetical protein
MAVPATAPSRSRRSLVIHGFGATVARVGAVGLKLNRGRVRGRDVCSIASSGLTPPRAVSCRRPTSSRPCGGRINVVTSCPRWTPENRPSIDTSKPATTGRGDRDLQLLIESLSSGLLFFSLSPKRVLAVRMWESRVLCEISKALWKPFCGFHGAVICIAIFGIAHDRADRGDAVPLPACRSSFLEAPTWSFWIGGPLHPLRDSPASTLPRETHGFTSSRPRRASRSGPWCASFWVRT